MDNQTTNASVKTKFCKHCGVTIPEDAIICTACGRQVEDLKSNAAQPNIVINNDNHTVNSNINKNTVGVSTHAVGNAKNKWVSLILCLFLGYVGAHKFYEGKAGMGILYLFTGGLFFVGVVIDFLAILAKPNPYYV